LNKTFVVFEYKQMTIYRTRYRDPKRHSWLNQSSPTHVGAELRPPKKVEIQVERFEINLGKDAILKFLNEQGSGVTRGTRVTCQLRAPCVPTSV
jgi:hypothetical protein